jgi:hypothetical protein
MSLRIKRFLIGMCLTLVFMGVTLACVRTPSRVHLESEISSRALLYWRLVKGTEFKRAYEEFLSSDTKKWFSYRSFIAAMSRNNYTNFDVEKVNFSELNKRAVVTIKFDTTWNDLKFSGMKMRQSWVLENGKWRLVLPRSSNPFS